MHRPDRFNYGPIRSAAWLLTDLIDEAVADPATRGVRVDLMSQRWRVVEILHVIRKLEEIPSGSTPPGQLDLVRDFPA